MCTGQRWENVLASLLFSQQGLRAFTELDVPTQVGHWDDSRHVLDQTGHKNHRAPALVVSRGSDVSPCPQRVQEAGTSPSRPGLAQVPGEGGQE